MGLFKKPSNKQWERAQKKIKSYEQYEEAELWGLEATLAKFILPRLVGFRDTCCSYPHGLSEDDWTKELNKMIVAFYLLANQDDWYDEIDFSAWELQLDGDKINVNKENREVIEKMNLVDARNGRLIKQGLDSFAKYYRDLWS